VWGVWVYSPVTTYLKSYGLFLQDDSYSQGAAIAGTGVITLAAGVPTYVTGTGVIPATGWVGDAHLVIRPASISDASAYDTSKTIYYDDFTLKRVITVGVKGVESDCDFYWNKGDNSLSQDGTAPVLAATDVLAISYVGEFPLTAKVVDDAEVAANAARMGGSFTGIVEAVEDNSNINGSTNAFQYGGGLLKTYAKIGTTVEYDTFKAGYYPGENVIVDLPDYDIDNLTMLIVSASMSYQGKYIKYHIKLVDGAGYSDWAMFYQKDKGGSIAEDVAEDGVIATSQDVDETAYATETITTETSTIYKWSSTLYVGENVYPG
jgi:hypothetical protein